MPVQDVSKAIQDNIAYNKTQPAYLTQLAANPVRTFHAVDELGSSASKVYPQKAASA